MRGRRTSACAMSRRCCSPPETSPIGRSAYAVAPTSSIDFLHPVSHPAARQRGTGHAPARTVGAEPHDVDAPDPQAGVEGSSLRQVADQRPGIVGRVSEHLHGAVIELLEAEDDL